MCEKMLYVICVFKEQEITLHIYYSVNIPKPIISIIGKDAEQQELMFIVGRNTNLYSHFGI